MLRILVGAALLVGFFATSGREGAGALHWLLLIGVVPLLTGLFSTCPLYSILGLNTCPMKRG